MVNLGLNWSSLLGLIVAVAGAGLYFLRTWNPKLARDHDIFFAAVGLLCGGILLFQGWRLDPILAFGQFLLTGTAIFFAVETVKLRGITTQQAKNRVPIVDDDRPVNPNYGYAESDVDELEPFEGYAPNRRIRGTDDQERSGSRNSYEDDYRRRPGSRNATYDRPDDRMTDRSADRTSKRRPRPERPTNNDWGDIPPVRETKRPRGDENWDVGNPAETKASRSRPRNKGGEYGYDDTAYNPDSEYSRGPVNTSDYSNEYGDTPPARPKKRRPSESRYKNQEEITTDYVEYTPVDAPAEGNIPGDVDEEN